MSDTILAILEIFGGTKNMAIKKLDSTEGHKRLIAICVLSSLSTYHESF